MILLFIFVAKKSLQDLKQLFFKLKDDVFGTAKMNGFGCNTSKLTEILKSYFGDTMKMSDIIEPRSVCCSAVRSAL